MDLLNLFDSKKEFKRAPVAVRNRNDDTSSEYSEYNTVYSCATDFPVYSGTDYAKQYQEEEKELIMQVQNVKINDPNDPMDLISEGTVPVSLATELTQAKSMDPLDKKYDFEHRPCNLPIMENKEDILNMVNSHMIGIIEGSTGCGKSTQVPQFFLDYCREHHLNCNIIVTQPRRIAALSIAKRVAKERKWPLGSIVGVQVGMFKLVSADTRLTYCTTGVLLNKLMQAKSLAEYTHIIIDEVHERDKDMDFLLLVIKKLIATNSRNIKLVLMSATFNVDKFSKYFAIATEKGLMPAPITSVAKKRNYKVFIHYLCQIHVLGAVPEVSFEKPEVSHHMMQFCIRLLKIFDEIDLNDEMDDDDNTDNRQRHTVLMFLPGIYEIEEMHGLLSSFTDLKWDIVVLHSSITHEEQSKVFTPPPKGYRRVILSTNIAESSITISDVKYVIDFCLSKQLVTDQTTNFQSLELCWASKANCDQRSGRAGRVMDGRVYRLVPKEFFDALNPESEPEIRRAPLENLVLKSKIIDLGPPKAILALAIDPPDLSNITNTILLLKEVGGLLNKPYYSNKLDLVSKHHSYDPFDGILTDLGRIMEALPLDIHLAKLIALGHVFNVLRETIIMAASMAVRSIFSYPFQKRMQAYEHKIDWADGSTSDCLAFLNAYRVWQRHIIANHFKRKSQAERMWAARNFIQIKAMHECDYLIEDITLRLQKLGIKETEGSEKVVIDDIKGFILKIVIAGAFYPNYFVKITSDAEHQNKEATRTLGGLDPSRTVYLRGWPLDQPGRLYAKEIQKLFAHAFEEREEPVWKNALVEFDSSQRIYVMFPDDNQTKEKKHFEIPGKVSSYVYKALKLRKLFDRMSVKVPDPKTSKLIAEKQYIPFKDSFTFYTKENYDNFVKILPKFLPKLPSLNTKTIQIRVIKDETNFKPSQFWAQYDNKEAKKDAQKIEEYLNSSKVSLEKFDVLPDVGSLVAAKKNDMYYRAVIEYYYKINNNDAARVFFIDKGFACPVAATELRAIKNQNISNLPALAFECRLSGIEPSAKKDVNGDWCSEAQNLFALYMSDKFIIFGTVYSVVDSVVSLDIECVDGKEKIKLNKLLVENEYAQEREESYLSKYNHDLRESYQDFKPEQTKYLEFHQYDKKYLINVYPNPPDEDICSHDIMLMGPYSPLEIHLASLSASATNKTVSIETISVNSILLDSDLESPYERLVVSSVINQSRDGSKLTLRDTTLMPLVPGLTALICLIFAPKIELRRNSKGSHYVGALCGLGADPKRGIALMPEHDIEVLFNTEFTIDDLQNINRLRHWMNMGICVAQNEDEDLEEQAMMCQHKVIQFIRTLTERNKTYQKSEKIANFDKWNLYDKTLFMRPTNKVMKEDSVYPLHSALMLDERDEDIDNLVDHIEELRYMAVCDPRQSNKIDVVCQLCDMQFFYRHDLRNHLVSADHMRAEKQLPMR
ncbi:hypothetical protein TKK_0001370 [Trichogramma kaykai]|uniref:Probable ATP-dependent RNA helicase spindle-E n=1 Tax=Trichogramma kaykai TaxID=54128 RepID=A0ABD2WS86_9HYME